MKPSKSSRYLCISHWGGISFEFKFVNKKSDEVCFNTGGGRGQLAYLYIRVKGNESMIGQLYSQLQTLQDKFENKVPGCYIEFQRFINDIYMNYFNHVCYYL